VSWADTRYHPEGRCAFCGARPSQRVQLQRSLLLSTRAKALTCVDNVACLRRLRRASDRAVAA
jgi:hypothetical protein